MLGTDRGYEVMSAVEAASSSAEEDATVAVRYDSDTGDALRVAAIAATAATAANAAGAAVFGSAAIATEGKVFATAFDAAFVLDRFSADDDGVAAASALAQQPLWLKDPVSSGFRDAWEELCATLSRDSREDWAVWLEWWEARRDGSPVDVKNRDAEGLTLEEARVLQPYRQLREYGWSDPARVNRLLREIEDEFAALRAARKQADNDDAEAFAAAVARINLYGYGIYHLTKDKSVELRPQPEEAAAPADPSLAQDWDDRRAGIAFRAVALLHDVTVHTPKQLDRGKRCSAPTFLGAP